MAIKCCKDCVPPKRHSGCHSKCEQYLKEKEQWEKDKISMKANLAKTPNVTPYDFEEIAYVGCKRHKRPKRNR